jgi:hypothetical protein
MQFCAHPTDSLQPITITLDNTQSDGAVGWQATIEDDVPQTSTPWATAAPASGVVPAGQTTTFQLTPDSSICAQLFTTLSTVNLHAQVSLTSGGSGVYNFTETVGLVG